MSRALAKARPQTAASQSELSDSNWIYEGRPGSDTWLTGGRVARGLGAAIRFSKNSVRTWFFKEPWFERFLVEPEMVP